MSHAGTYKADNCVSGEPCQIQIKVSDACAGGICICISLWGVPLGFDYALPCPCISSGSAYCSVRGGMFKFDDANVLHTSPCTHFTKVEGTGAGGGQVAPGGAEMTR